MAGLRGRTRRDDPWSRDLVLCGVSSRDDDDDDGHNLIRGHDGCWTQTGRIQEAVFNLDKQMGRSSRLSDMHADDEDCKPKHHRKSGHSHSHGSKGSNSYSSKLRGDSGPPSDHHRAFVEAANIVARTSPCREAASVQDVKPGSPSPSDYVKTVDTSIDYGLEVHQSPESMEAFARPELLSSSCRRARVERTCEEDFLQSRAHGLNSDSKSKRSAWPSEANARGSRKSGAVAANPHARSEEGGSKCRGSPSRTEPARVLHEQQDQVEAVLNEEGLAVPSTTESGSEAAAAASGIWYAATNSPTPSTPTPSSPRVTIPLADCELNMPQPPSPCAQCQSPPCSDVPEPEASEYNPLRPEYPPFVGLPEGRLKTARRLHSEIAAFVARNDSAAEESRRFRQLIVDKVRLAAHSCWENSTVEVYGSFSTNLFLPHSDVDLVVTQGSNCNANQVRQNLQKLADKLQVTRWCCCVRPIDKTSVPVIKMEVDVAFLDEGHRLALAMGLHARLGEGSPLMSLDRDALATLRGQLGWGPAPEGGCSHRPAEDGESSEESGGRAPPVALRDAAAASRRIPVDITFYSNQIKKNLLQQHGVVYSPLDSREFIRQEVGRYPAIRPLVLVLKHFLYRSELNDAYSGGLSSHSLILLLIFYFNNLDAEGGAAAAARGDDIPADCLYGEWLLRVVEWLARFPFDTVGIPVGSKNQFVALNTLGQWQLQLYCSTGSRRYCSAQAVRDWLRRCSGPLWDQGPSVFLAAAGGGAGSRIAEEPPGQLHIEDPFTPGYNIARNSWKWQQAVALFQRAHEKLAVRCGPESLFRPMEIYLASPEADEAPLLEALLDRAP